MEPELKKKTEVAPPGFEPVIDALKDKFPDDPSRAFAIAWGMHNRGITPKKENGEPYDAMALYRRHQHECGQEESMSLSSMGQLARSGVKEAPYGSDPKVFDKPVVGQKRESGRFVTPFREAAGEQVAGVPTVALITAGCGNLHDGNFYPPEVLQQAAPLFEGKPSFINHSSNFESEDLPERRVESIGGWWKSVHASDLKGNVAIIANLAYMADLEGQLTEAGATMKGIVEAAIRYQREYPDSESVISGFSIDADGPSTPMPSEQLIQRYPQFRDELSQREEWNCVQSIDHVTSVDVVTVPARGGRVLGLTESQRWRKAFTDTLSSQTWRESFRALLSETTPSRRQ